jgi:heme-degrading monooxygenase HmoA
MSFWDFKQGKREEGFSKLDRILNTLAQDVEGFRGYMSLLSFEDANAVTILTLWQDEEALKKSEQDVFVQATKNVRDLLEKPPRIVNYRVFSTQLFMRQKF